MATAEMTMLGKTYAYLVPAAPSSVSVPTNTVEPVIIQTTADLNESLSGQALGKYDSLTLNVDPSTANLADYSVDFSSNLLPEPTAVALVGIAVFGLIKRNRGQSK